MGQHGNGVITIGRQCGSGGHTIGVILAQQLGLSFFDKTIVEMVAARTKLSAEFLHAHQDYFANEGGAVGYGTRFNSPERIGSHFSEQFLAVQSEVILEAAYQEPCVIVGRCADYILSEHFAALNVFIHAEMSYRIDRSVKEHGLPREKAYSILTQRDTARAHLYSFYTDQCWGDVNNYDLCLDSGRLGVRNCVGAIADTYEKLRAGGIRCLSAR